MVTTTQLPTSLKPHHGDVLSFLSFDIEGGNMLGDDIQNFIH